MNNDKKTINRLHESTPTPSEDLRTRIMNTLDTEYEPAKQKRFFVLPTVAAGVALAIALVALPQIDLQQTIQVSVDKGHLQTVPLVAQALNEYEEQLQKNILYLHVEYRNGKDIERWTELMGSTRKDGNTDWDEYQWISAPQETSIRVRNILTKDIGYHYVNIETNVLSNPKRYIAPLATEAELGSDTIRAIAELPIEFIGKEKRSCEWCIYGNPFQTELEEIAASENAVEIEAASAAEIGYSITQTRDYDDRVVQKNYYFDADSKKLLRVHSIEVIDGEELETLVTTFVEQSWLPYDEYKSVVKKII